MGKLEIPFWNIKFAWRQKNTALCFYRTWCGNAIFGVTKSTGSTGKYFHGRNNFQKNRRKYQYKSL